MTCVWYRNDSRRTFSLRTTAGSKTSTNHLTPTENLPCFSTRFEMFFRQEFIHSGLRLFKQGLYFFERKIKGYKVCFVTRMLLVTSARLDKVAQCVSQRLFSSRSERGERKGSFIKTLLSRASKLALSLLRPTTSSTTN